jgi:hypothetical protein
MVEKTDNSLVDLTHLLGLRWSPAKRHKELRRFPGATAEVGHDMHASFLWSIFEGREP